MTWNKICVMLPTFKRSNTYLPEFIASAMKCSSPDVVNFAFCVNAADKETKEFLQKYNFGKFEHCEVYEALATPDLAAYFNLLYMNAPLANKPGTMVSMFGDDMTFETPGWAEEILRWVNERKGIGVYFCNDEFEAHGRCCVNMAVTREMVELTEEPFMAVEFPAEMIDVVWWHVGKTTKSLHYFPELVVRHNHNRRKPNPHWDPTYQRLRVVQDKVHNSGGKRRAIAIGQRIGQKLLAKGIIGDSDC
jgi:hypothetical protein